MSLNNNRGVTLVEMMIALTVFLLVFMGLLQTSLLSIDHNLRNILRDEATTIAAGRMNELKNVAFDSPTLNPGTNCQIVLRNFRNFTKQYNVCDVITNLPEPGGTVNTRNVQVVVGWNHKNEIAVQAPTGREFQLSITTVRRR